MISIEVVKKDPLVLVNAALGDASVSGDVKETATQCIGTVKEWFRATFTNDIIRQSLPHAGPEYHGQLVKFHGLVVEEPQEDEYYIPVILDEGAGRWVNVGLFKEPEFEASEEGQFGSTSTPYSSMLNRKTIKVAGIPGLSDWIRPRHSSVLPVLDVIVYSEGDSALCLTGKTAEFYGVLEAGECPALHLIESREVSHFTGQAGNIDCREELLSYLTTIFNGDGTAAKLFLAYLVSTIDERKAGLATSLLIGDFPLNLVLGENNEAAVEVIKGLVKELRPKVHSVLIASSHLDQVTLAPSFDVQTGHLRPGELQLSHGTHLVLDETRLEQGQFTEKATANLRAIMDLLDHQHVSFDFGFQAVQIPSDFPLLSLSSSKSIFAFPLSRKVSVTQQPVEVPAEVVDAWRECLEQCRACKVTIPKDTADRLEAAYVELRKSKEGRSKLDENQFATILNLAKIISKTHLCPEMTWDHWMEASSMLDTI